MNNDLTKLLEAKKQLDDCIEQVRQGNYAFATIGAGHAVQIRYLLDAISRYRKEAVE